LSVISAQNHYATDVPQTSFFRELARRVEELGGFRNAHLHLDRSGTLDETQRILQSSEGEGDSHYSLQKKHSLIPLIHESECYDPDVLQEKLRDYLLMMAHYGTTVAESLIDVSFDRVGLTGIHVARQVSEELREVIDFRIATYNPLGFRDHEPQRWELFEEAVVYSDFIGLLPERDDRLLYPDHIGFEESCRRSLELAMKHDKKIQIHVDQQNHEFEKQSETVCAVMEDMGLVGWQQGEPHVWFIHVISPSTYSEERFQNLVSSFVRLNIGVVVCPSGAISMRQLSPLSSPTRNSIARVLDFLAAGVPVRIGSDNICDVTSPAGTVNLIEELAILANAMRFYDIDILAKIGSGVSLDEKDRERIASHLEQDRAQVRDAMAKFTSSQI
jgi:cytosine deaminase